MTVTAEDEIASQGEVSQPLPSKDEEVKSKPPRAKKDKVSNVDDLKQEIEMVTGRNSLTSLFCHFSIPPVCLGIDFRTAPKVYTANHVALISGIARWWLSVTLATPT